MSRLFDRHRRTHPQERKLRDDELVTTGNAYLADREGIVSQSTCTVGALKERLNANEIRVMGFAKRVEAPLHDPAERTRLRALALASVARGVTAGFRAARSDGRRTIPVSPSDIGALDAAIANLEKQVALNGQQVVCRSVGELICSRDALTRQMAGRIAACPIASA